MATTSFNIVLTAQDKASAAIGSVANKLGAVSSGSGAGSAGGLKLAAAMGALAAGAAAAAAAVGAAALAFGAFGRAAVGAAAENEQLETSFVTLLGSAGAARDRMNELAAFAASTPFEIPQVVRASRTLETLTKGALSTGDGLRMVGDVAALTGQPFDELAVTIGRAYDGLQSGRAIGESLMRLQEIGVVSGDVRGQLEALQKAGVKGDAAWQVLAKSLGRFGGEMDRQSATFSGKVSNMADAWDQLQVAFGKPIMDALKPWLDSIIAYLEKMKPVAAEIGQAIAGSLDLIRKAFSDGTLWGKAFDTFKVVAENIALFMGAKIGQALKSAAALFVGVLLAGVNQVDAVLAGRDESMGESYAKGVAQAGEAFGVEEVGGLKDLGMVIQSQLREIWGELPRQAAAATEEAKAKIQPILEGAKQEAWDGKGASKSSGDSLARVGIFAGGASGATNYLKSTADNSFRMAKSLSKIEAKIGGTTGAAWANA